MARIPGIDTAFALFQAQTEALAQLPEVITSLTTAVRGLGDTVVQARETLAAVQRLTARMDAVVGELEEPLRELAPGLRKLAVVLDDPVVGDLPDTVRQVRADVLPVLKTLADTHEKVAFLAGSTDRLMGGLAGSGLLGRRRPPAVTVVEQDPPRR